MTTYNRYCIAYLVSNKKPVTLPMTYVRSDEDAVDDVEHAFARVKTAALSDAHVRSPQLSSPQQRNATG